jgi:hypothetical protein
MQSESWGSVLATIAACGGAGAFIDFWIGKSGQQRVRGWLETWWLRVSYVRWGTLGRDEAVFAVEVIDRLFGSRLLSARRMMVVTAVTFVAVGLILSRVSLDHGIVYWHDFLRVNIFLWFILAMFSVTASLSITRFAATKVALILTKSPYLNFFGFMFLLLFQYLWFCYLAPFIILIHQAISFVMGGGISDTETWYDFFTYVSLSFAREIWALLNRVSITPLSPVWQVTHLLSSITFPKSHFVVTERFMDRLSDLLNLIPNLIRFSITAIFVGSFFLRTVQRPFMELWARIIESEKPVFTLLFSGIAVLAKGIQSLVKNGS